METFAQAFARNRKEKGPNETFPWNGKTYSTNRADDKKKPKAETAPPKRPAPPPMSKIDKARAEAKATPRYASKIGPKQQGKLIGATRKPGYDSKIGPKQQGKLIGAANVPAYNSKIGPTRTIKDKVITNTKRMIEEARRRTRSAVGIKG